MEAAVTVIARRQHDRDIRPIELPYVKLTHARLAGADFSGLLLYSADLSGADLISANFAGSGLNFAVLQDADLHGAVLNEARLVGANLTSANLVGASLVRADLRLANLTDAMLSQADLTDEYWVGASLNPGYVSNIKALGPADFTGANLWFALWPETLSVPRGCRRGTDRGRLVPDDEGPGGPHVAELPTYQIVPDPSTSPVSSVDAQVTLAGIE